MQDISMIYPMRLKQKTRFTGSFVQTGSAGWLDPARLEFKVNVKITEITAAGIVRVRTCVCACTFDALTLAGLLDHTA